MKLESKKIKSDLRIACLDAFFNAVDHTKKEKTVKKFLSDILTESEQIMLGRRILIAARLLEGQSYDRIVREMNVGQDTVYRVKKWLSSRHKGIGKVINELKRKVKLNPSRRSEFRDYYATGGFAELRRKYKNYYWLSDLLDELNSKE